MTVTLAVFWLSGSAAWANGLNGLKGTTQGILHTTQCQHFCKGVLTGSFSELTISVVSYRLSYALFVLLLSRFHFVGLFSVNFAFIVLQIGSSLKSISSSSTSGGGGGCSSVSSGCGGCSSGGGGGGGDSGSSSVLEARFKQRYVLRIQQISGVQFLETVVLGGALILMLPLMLPSFFMQ